MADRRQGRPDPETTSEAAERDWYGRDLSGTEHVAVAFLETDLTTASGSGATFTDCTFRGVRFNASVWTSSAFTNCTFRRCTFFGARFTGCKLVGSMFDRCTFEGVHVDGGDWSFVGLPGAALGTAAFSDVRMREVDLVGARAAGGTLVGCDLSGAWLHQADLSGCDLRGSDLSALDPRETDVRGATVTVDQALVVATSLGLRIGADRI